MHRRSRGGRDEFFDFGDPFAGFGGFPGQRSLISGFFGGRDPFDDPFFRNPFGSMFEPSFFGGPGIPFANMQPSGFLDHQAPEPKRPRGPIIEELNSDDEERSGKESRNRKNSSKKPLVEDPDDEENRNLALQLMDHRGGQNHRHIQPQTSSFTFQSSSVTYGGSNGTYYTSSRTRRAGSDGVVFEESKEADTATRQATHRVSRGIHTKGHSVTRKLNPDGKVDTMQTLHNLNEDELGSFENAWARNSRSLPGWHGSTNGFDNIAGGIGQNGQMSRGGLALPSTDQHPQVTGRITVEGGHAPGSSRTQQVNRNRRDARYRSA
ncbi:hypothetical protein IC575_015409 [Cucumis melo]|uniref:Uncharacterized protein LOC103490935 n=1 Tax=Cucumis melo TaxID=3656 RepID=A0A1S3BLG1_CUCME|nr:uncharacterized protein LOC103490935 [Cucumis melo]